MNLFKRKPTALETIAAELKPEAVDANIESDVACWRAAVAALAADKKPADTDTLKAAMLRRDWTAEDLTHDVAAMRRHEMLFDPDHAAHSEALYAKAKLARDAEQKAADVAKEAHKVASDAHHAATSHMHSAVDARRLRTANPRLFGLATDAVDPGACDTARRSFED